AASLRVSQQALHFMLQPLARNPPVASHRAFAHVQHVRNLLARKASKNLQLNDLGGALVIALEGRQSPVDEFVIDRFRCRHVNLVQSDFLWVTSPLEGSNRARGLDQNLAHRAGGRREEVSAVGALSRPLLRPTQEKLTYERSRLQNMTRLFIL